MESLFGGKREKSVVSGPRLKQNQSLTKAEIREFREDWQIPVTEKYQEISKELNGLLDKLITSFKEKDFSSLPPAEQKRMEEYQKILSESNIRIALSESKGVNAGHFVKKGIIVVNFGLLKSVLDQNLGMDGVAFIVSHEIAHLLYEKSDILSKKEKEGILGRQDKEYQCDKDGLILANEAGFSAYAATVFFTIGKNEVLPTLYNCVATKYDFGFLSSHPDSLSRQVRLQEICEKTILENYREGINEDFSDKVKAELRQEIQPTEQLKKAREEFDERFYQLLDKKIKDKLIDFNPKDYYENSRYAGTPIPEIFEKKGIFASFNKQLPPEALDYSIGIFVSCVNETIKEFRFSFEDIKKDPKSLLESLEKHLPCQYEVDNDGRYDPFNNCVRCLFDRYREAIKKTMGVTTEVDGNYTKFLMSKRKFRKKYKREPIRIVRNISYDELSGEMVVNLVKEGLRKMGVSAILPMINMEGRLDELLGKVGSEALVVRLASSKTIKLLRKDPFCRDVLDKTFRDRISDHNKIDLSFVLDKNTPSGKLLELLLMPKCSKETKREIITRFIIPKIKDKTIPPLELMLVIREIGLDKFCGSREDFSKAVKGYGNDEAEKKFWEVMLFANGEFPEGVSSPKELAAYVKDIKRYGIEISNTVGASVSGEADIKKGTVCLRSVDHTRPGFYKYSSAQSENLTEEEALTLARFCSRLSFETLENLGSFNSLEIVSRYYIANPGGSLSRNDISENCLTEWVGPSIEAENFVFLRYLIQKKFSVLSSEEKEEAVEWVEEYLPRESELRDLVLANIYERKNFAEALSNKANKEFFVKFLSLYDKSSFRREAVSHKIYQAFRDDTQSLDDKISFILTCFPHATLTRDEVIDEMLKKHLENSKAGVDLSELHKAYNYYSGNDRSSERNRTIIDVTLGAYLHNWGSKDKLDLARWLFLEGEKTRQIINIEDKVHNRLDILPSLMSSSELRHKALEMIFFGKNGLATEGNEEYFDKFIDEAFDKYFGPKRDSEDKLVVLGRELIKNTLHTVNPYKREKLLCRMFDLAQDESSKNIEAFLPNWVAGYSASAVKFLQIVGSRPEVKETYPELYRRCEDAMSNAEGMSIRDLIVSLSTNPELRNGDYKLSKIIGSASIKVVLKGEDKEKEPVVVKAQKLGVGRNLEKEREELCRILTSIEDTLRENFNIESIPFGVVDRACQAVKSEIDFSLELRNSAKLTSAIGGVSTDEYTVTTPKVVSQDDNLIIESMGSGVTLKEYLEQPLDDEERNKIAGYVQAIYLNLLNKGTVLSDMHSGNILVDKEASGKFKFTLIDTGSLYQLDEDELKTYKKILAGIVVSELEKNGGIESLLQNAIVPSKSFLSSRNIGETLLSEKLLDGGIHKLLGNKIYKNNRERINSCLQKMQEAESATAKPLMLMGLFDDLGDGIVPNSSYWSIVGTAKVYGLDRYHKENIPIYMETFGSTVKEEFRKSHLFGSLFGGLLS